MIDSFLAWAQAFMLQVALAVRSGRSLAVPAISSLFFSMFCCGAYGRSPSRASGRR